VFAKGWALQAKSRKKFKPVIISRVVNYYYGSRSIPFGLIAIIPLLIVYEVLAINLNEDKLIEVRNYADVFFKSILDAVGIEGYVALGMLLGAAIFIAFFLRIDKRHPVKLRYLFGVIIESAIYAVALSYVVDRALQQLYVSAPEAHDRAMQIMLSFGAGIYEELVFRAFLFGISALTLKRLLGIGPFLSYLLPALFSSAVFSWIHYLDGTPFDLETGLYRFLAGLFFCLLYQLRGLGVVAWTHTLYDLYLVL